MPLQDNYESDKVLKNATHELLPILTHYFSLIEHERYGFLIMICDLREGIMQYGSDLDRRDAIKVVKGWLKKQEDILNSDIVEGKVVDETSKKDEEA